MYFSSLLRKTYYHLLLMAYMNMENRRVELKKTLNLVFLKVVLGFRDESRGLLEDKECYIYPQVMIYPHVLMGIGPSRIDT